MRLLICLLCLFSCFTLEAAQSRPKLTSIKIVDRNGFSETINIKEKLDQYERVNFIQPQPYQTVLRTYERDAQGNSQSYLTSYYTNGQIKQYLEIVNSRAMGLYQEWYPYGQVKLTARVIGGQADFDETVQSNWMFDGLTTAYFEDGKVSGKIEYKKGSLEGKSEHYHPNGNLRLSLTYKGGVPHGDFIENFPNGKPARVSHFEEGVPDGIAKIYWLDGKLAGEETFKKGILLSGTYYPKEGEPFYVKGGEGKRLALQDGKLFEISEILDGVPYGKVWLYNSDESLESIYHTRNGMKEGEETLFYPNGKKKLIISWHEDKIHGVVKSYYSNGTQMSQRDMANNKQQGFLTSWYKNGDLMLIEEYDNDTLVSGKYFKKGEMRPITQIEKGTGIATLYDPEGTFAQKVTYENGLPVAR